MHCKIILLYASMYPYVDGIWLDCIHQTGSQCVKHWTRWVRWEQRKEVNCGFLCHYTVAGGFCPRWWKSIHIIKWQYIYICYTHSHPYIHQLRTARWRACIKLIIAFRIIESNNLGNLPHIKRIKYSYHSVYICIVEMQKNVDDFHLYSWLYSTATNSFAATEKIWDKTIFILNGMVSHVTLLLIF